MKRLRQKIAHWEPLDWAVGLYATLTGGLILMRRTEVTGAPLLLLLHMVLLVLLLTVPARGSRWERRSGRSRWVARCVDGLRFVRYAYPLFLVVFFFEEVQYTVNCLFGDNPYWFEPFLYRADRVLFGQLPALALAGWGTPLLDEVMHAFYFSYYPILIFGLWFSWRKTGGEAQPPPGPGFGLAVTSMTLAFLLAFLHYPLLPARGPWESAELMAGLPAFQGWLFTPLVERIIARAAVSGGCFPSAHVAGTWGLVVGVGCFHRRVGAGLAVLAAGMSLACIYTRYHHAVDVPAGLICGLAGGWLGVRLLAICGRQERG